MSYVQEHERQPKKTSIYLIVREAVTLGKDDLPVGAVPTFAPRKFYASKTTQYAVEARAVGHDEGDIFVFFVRTTTISKAGKSRFEVLPPHVTTKKGQHSRQG